MRIKYVVDFVDVPFAYYFWKWRNCLHQQVKRIKQTFGKWYAMPVFMLLSSFIYFFLGKI